MNMMKKELFPNRLFIGLHFFFVLVLEKFRKKNDYEYEYRSTAERDGTEHDFSMRYYYG
jgi:hypothetical protein